MQTAYGECVHDNKLFLGQVVLKKKPFLSYWWNRDDNDIASDGKLGQLGQLSLVSYHVGGVGISDIGHMITLLSMVMMEHSTYWFQVVSYHGNCVCL